MIDEINNIFSEMSESKEINKEILDKFQRFEQTFKRDVDLRT